MRDTIDMALEAGIDWTDFEINGGFNALKTFEALVRADERERVMNEPLTKAQWQRFEDEIRADEREACAKVCEKAIASIWEYSPEDVKQTGTNVCNNLAASIRARGNT